MRPHCVAFGCPSPNWTFFHGKSVTPSGMLNVVFPSTITVVKFVGAMFARASPYTLKQFQLSGSRRFDTLPLPVHRAVAGRSALSL